MAKREDIDGRRRRARRIIRGLRREYPDADCALTHRSAYELLVATILSAQSTDETVNKVTRILFDRFPTVEALATGNPADVEAIIYPTGFFRQKTRSILGSARKIVEQFEGRVPDDMDKLLQLPGVARKTANVVLGTWFGRNEGVVVDTHVGRLSERLELTWNHKNSKDAPRIEKDLMQVIPRGDWTYFSHALIWHGRKVCSARNPACDACRVAGDCPSAGRFASGRGARRDKGKEPIQAPDEAAGRRAGRKKAVRP